MDFNHRGGKAGPRIERNEMSIKQAIEALESCTPGDYSTGHVIHPSYDEDKVNAALAALRSMPQGEPVKAAAWMRHDDPRQVISAMEKSDAVAAGGAFAASVARYDIPLVHQHEATPHTAPLSDETIQLANVALYEMPRNAGMDALVKQVHSSEAFSFETAAANVERAVLRGGEKA